MRTRDKILIELAETVDYWNYVSGLYNKRSHDILGLRMTKKDRKVEQAVRRLVSIGEIEKEISPDGDVRYKITSLGLNTLNRTINLNKIIQNPWDKKWRFVIFDIEEKNKEIRECVKDRLRQLWFGQLQKSVWVSPHPIIDEVEELLKAKEIKTGVLLFEAEKIGSSSNKEIAHQAWDLPMIAERYVELVENYNKDSLTDEEKAGSDFANEYLEILKIDPYLPDEILPQDWPGKNAKKLFNNLRISKNH